MKKAVKLIMVALMVICMGVAVGSTLTPSYTQSVYAAVYKQGSTGSTVKTIQQKLKNWGYYKGSVDGIYGSQTKEAVRYFQRKNGLTVDRKSVV